MDKQEEHRQRLADMLKQAFQKEAAQEFGHVDPDAAEELSSILFDTRFSDPAGSEGGFESRLIAWSEKNKPEYTDKRDRAAAMAPTDPKGALAIARTIREPWFRCQAIAYAAEYTQEFEERNALVREAFDAAAEQQEPNRLVSVSAWPLWVLCKHGQWPELEEEVRRLLAVLDTEPSPVRRANALDRLCRTIRTAPGHIARPVFEAFVAACLTPLCNGKRNRRGHSHLAGMLDTIYNFIDKEWAEALVDSISGPTMHQQAMAEIQRLHGNADAGKGQPS